jgi:hypothetical protein
MAKRTPRVKLLTLLGGGILLAITVWKLLTTPYLICSDCEGTCKQIEPSIHGTSGGCRSCRGKGRYSYIRKWTLKPEFMLVGTVDESSWDSYIKPLSEREHLRLHPDDPNLLMMGIIAESAHAARQARKIIVLDSREKGYLFIIPETQR